MRRGLSDPSVYPPRDPNLFVPFADHIESGAGWRAILTMPAAVAGAVALVAAIIRVEIGGQSAASLVAALAVGAMIVALVLVYIQLRKRNAGLFLADHRVGVVNALGRRSGVDITHVDHLHLCSVLGLNVSGATPLLLIINRNARVAKTFYRPDALQSGGLENLAKQAGLQVKGSLDEQYTPAELQKHFPSALSRIQTGSVAILQHPRRTAWIVSGITIGAFLALTIILLARSSH